MTTCNSCGATYESLQPGGLRYFHQCPPLSEAELAAGLGLPEDPELRHADEHAAIANAPRVRANARNENAPPSTPAYALVDGAPVARVVVDWRAENARRDTEITAHGAGSTPGDDAQHEKVD